jgi:hypothetical protein
MDTRNACLIVGFEAMRDSWGNERNNIYELNA